MRISNLLKRGGCGSSGRPSIRQLPGAVEMLRELRLAVTESLSFGQATYVSVSASSVVQWGAETVWRADSL